MWIEPQFIIILVLIFAAWYGGFYAAGGQYRLMAAAYEKIFDRCESQTLEVCRLRDEMRELQTVRDEAVREVARLSAELAENRGHQDSIG